MILDVQADDFFEVYGDIEIKVFVDEKEIKFVKYIDITEGYVVYMLTDCEEKLIIENNDIKTEKISGDVMVQLRKRK